jgi:hypothetical protein
LIARKSVRIVETSSRDRVDSSGIGKKRGLCRVKAACDFERSR